MYVPKHFDASDLAWCHKTMRAESFATLVSADESGVPFATHIPTLLHETRGPLGTLAGHVARANPHARHLAAGRPTLVVFQGPHTYVSPSWYTVHPAVPTWNYVAVHAYGVPEIVEDPARIKAHLEALVRTYEAGRETPWSLDGLAEDYVSGMIRGIVAFEIPIDRLEGKAKLSQNRHATDRAGVIAGLRGTGDATALAVAEQMARAMAAASNLPAEPRKSG